MSSLYIPKYKKPKKPSRASREARAYRLVDKRDKNKCVLCKYLNFTDPQGEWLNTLLNEGHVYGSFGRERHHINGRTGDLLDNVDNIISLCKCHHDLVHQGKHPATGEQALRKNINDYMTMVLKWWTGQGSDRDYGW